MGSKPKKHDSEQTEYRFIIVKLKRKVVKAQALKTVWIATCEAIKYERLLLKHLDVGVKLHV